MKTKNYKVHLTLAILALAIVIFNQYTISSLAPASGGSVSTSSSGISLSAGATTEDIINAVIPSEADKIRPFTVNGQQIELSLDKNNLLLKVDPFPPNGGRGRNEVPQDLTPEQQAIYADLMYGTSENNFQDAVGGCLFCNAPGGAGGCFKKRTIRGLTYALLKQDWSQEEIEDELKVWMGYFFPGLAVKWATYYIQQGLDINDVPVDVATFSRQGKIRVESALQGGDISSIPDQVGGCF